MLTWPPAGPAVFAAEAGHTWSAGVPGLEPRLTGPEPVGLPITPYPIGVGRQARSAPVKSSRTGRGGQSDPGASGPGSTPGLTGSAEAVPGLSRRLAVTRPRHDPRPGQASERPLPAQQGDRLEQ